MAVHARDAFAAFHTKLDVATSAPAGTPRVLDEPVACIVVLLHFRLDLSKVFLVINDVVPAAFAVGVADMIGSNESVVSLALLFFSFLGRGLLASSMHVSFLIKVFIVSFGVGIAIGWLGLGIAIAIGIGWIAIAIGIVSFIGHVQADDDDTVIDVCWAVVCCSENTTLIITPAVIACSHSDGHGTVLDSLLHFRDIIHLLPVCSFGDNSLSILVSACIVFSLIRVIFL